MKTLIFGLIALASFNALAQTKILVFEDIGTKTATFKFLKAKENKVKLIAEFESTDCAGEGYGTCINRITTGSLDFMEREDREVYYVSEGNRISCGQTLNALDRSKLNPKCSFEIKAENVCVEWFAENDCIRMKPKHRVYMNIRN